MQAMAGKRPVPCPVAGRLGFGIWLSIFYLLRAAWLLCRRSVSLHPWTRLRTGNQIQFLQLCVPQRNGDVCLSLRYRMAGTMAALSLVGSRGSNGLRTDSLSFDRPFRSRCHGRVLGLAYL